MRSLWVSRKDLDLTGQTGIITGGNTGLGFETAQTVLAYNLSHLIITVRDDKKGKDAVGETEEPTYHRTSRGLAIGHVFV